MIEPELEPEQVEVVQQIGELPVNNVLDLHPNLKPKVEDCKELQSLDSPTEEVEHKHQLGDYDFVEEFHCQ